MISNPRRCSDDTRPPVDASFVDVGAGSDGHADPRFDALVRREARQRRRLGDTQRPIRPLICLKIHSLSGVSCLASNESITSAKPEGKVSTGMAPPQCFGGDKQNAGRFEIGLKAKIG